jgi:dihydrofolate reductase
MRKVILFMHLSLDGFIARPNGEMDWATMNDHEMGKYLIADLLSGVDSMLLGRVLYQGFEKTWPSVATSPSNPKELIDFAHWIEDSPKIVFSKTLERVEWKNSNLVKVKDNEGIAEEISKLKQQPGKDMVLFGGARFAQTCVKLGLVDEYRLKLEPVVLGNGKSLFEDIKDRMNLKLTHSKTFNSMVIGLYYQPVKSQ